MKHEEREEWRGVAFAAPQEDHALLFLVYAALPRTLGFRAASGAIAFNMLLDFFQASGEVPAIEASWSPTSDNHVTFMRLRGDPPDDVAAALGTWTGTRAAERGYGRVARVELRGDVVTARFEPSTEA